MNLESLERRVKALERQCARQQAALDIENLISAHNFLLAAGEGERIVEELFASDGDISVEYAASGIYRSPWKVRTFYVSEAIPGKMTLLAGMNRALNVSSEGDRATGVWMLIGNETDAGDLGPQAPGEKDIRRRLMTLSDEQGRRYQADWLFQRMEAQFVREESGWKIHDLHISEYFRCPFDRDWVRFALERDATDGLWTEYKFESLDQVYPTHMRHENLPTEATTYHWQYRPDALPELLFDPMAKDSTRKD